MAKAKPNTTTARIRYSQALKFAGEYLGDSEYAEREIEKGLIAGEVPWWCARFEAPPQYSGPGPGDPKFWEVDPDRLCTRDGPVVVLRTRGVHTKGDSAKRIDGAAAFGIELDHSALVRLNLLPPDDTDSNQVETRSGKRLIEAEVKRRAAEGERWDSITRLSENLHEWMKTVSDKPLVAKSIENGLRDWGLWPLISKK